MTTKCQNSKTTNKRSKTPNTIEDVFPCLSEFNKIICSLTGNKNYQHLEDSLLLYTKYIRSSISSNVKFGNCKFSVIYSNLKNHINNMLIFFHLYWSDIKQDITDHTSYLNKMSTLLNIYVDMELKTSFMETNNVRDPSCEIAARIFAALYIYLNNSEEHIFKVLLRIKDIEKYTKICNHIFMKSFTNLKTKITFITDVAYVKYLLAFKMWKKIEENFDKKKKINELAVMILGSRMPELRHELKFMPKPPRNKKNETRWLLHTDLKDTLHHFLLFENKMDNLKDLQRTKMKHQINLLHPWSNSSKLKQEISKDHINDSKSHNISSIDRNKPLKKSKKKAKQNNFIYIDITGDKIRVKRKKIKLGYLKIMKENVEKNKKHNYLKFSNELIATNKTNSNKSSKNSVKNEHLNVTNQVNNTVDVINRNVGIYPETLDKVHMGVKSTIDGDNREHDTNNSIPHIVHSSINYETDTLSNNLSIVENNVQSIKENTNVILNGETVMLLQKSPNSNLYIINKAVENARDHISDDESCLIKEKNRMISSEDCASFEVVNTSEHISFNLNQPQYSKELSCQENKFPVGRNKNIKIEPEEEGSLINGNCAAGTDLYMPYYKHCTSVLYNIVTHCRQCIRPATDSHVSCIESNSYFLPNNDSCTVSTTCNGDQIVESALYNQSFGTMRMNDYGNVAKYSGTTIKEQERNNCDYKQERSDISMSSDLLHSSELYAFDSFEMDSFFRNEDSEIMKSDSIDHSENIGFVHNIQETLENVLPEIFTTIETISI